VIAWLLAAAIAHPPPSPSPMPVEPLRAQQRRVLNRLAPAAPPANLATLAAQERRSGGYLFAPAQPPPGPNLLERFLRWLYATLRAFFERLFKGVRVTPGQTRAFGDVLLLVVGLLLAFVVYRLARLVTIDRRSAAARSESLAADIDSATLAGRARSLAARGEYRDAARLLYAAMLATVDERGAARVERSATVRDIRRRLRRSDPALLPAFDRVASLFIASAFAERPIDAAAWADAEGAFARIAGGQAAA
jgi:hypothetical protein